MCGILLAIAAPFWPVVCATNKEAIGRALSHCCRVVQGHVLKPIDHKAAFLYLAPRRWSLTSSVFGELRRARERCLLVALNLLRRRAELTPRAPSSAPVVSLVPSLCSLVLPLGFTHNPNVNPNAPMNESDFRFL